MSRRFVTATVAFAWPFVSNLGSAGGKLARYVVYGLASAGQASAGLKFAGLAAAGLAGTELPISTSLLLVPGTRVALGTFSAAASVGRDES